MSPQDIEPRYCEDFFTCDLCREQGACLLLERHAGPHVCECTEDAQP